MIELADGYYEDETPDILVWWSTRGIDLVTSMIAAQRYENEFRVYLVDDESYVRFGREFVKWERNGSWSTWVMKGTIRKLGEDGLPLYTADKNYLHNNDPRVRIPIGKDRIRLWCRRLRGIDTAT